MVLPTQSMTLASGAALLGLGEVATTLHACDPQFTYLGPPAFIKNPILDRFIPSSYRVVTSMATAPLYVSLEDPVEDRFQDRSGKQ